jgi:hypothetical protein
MIRSTKTKNLFPSSFLMAGHKRKPPRPRPDRTCGSCKAGVCIMVKEEAYERHQVERCDECGLFETDADAAAAVQHLLDLLHAEYLKADDTVADTMDRLVEGRRRP